MAAVVVAERGGAGRGLVASRDLAAGEVVLVDLPALIVPSPDAVHGVCSACLRKLSETSSSSCSCSTCGSRFCSHECATCSAGAPSFHTETLCRAFSSLDLRGLPDADAASATRFVLTMACLRAEAEKNEDDEASRSSYSALCAMTAPIDAVARLGANEVAKRVSSACSAAGVPQSPTASWVEEAAHWLAVEEANGFAALAPPTSTSEGVKAPSSSTPSSSPLPRVRGTAFYPRAFLFNHDCLPNAARFDDFEGQGLGLLEPAVAAALARGSVDFGPSSSALPPPTAAQRRTALVAATLHPLPAGEELSLSYVPLSWSRPERGARLAACYGFRCRCARCRGEEEAFGNGEDNEAELAAAIGEAASWVPPYSSEGAARGALERSLRLATEEAKAACSSSSLSPAAELGYVRAFLSKFSCPAPRKKEGREDDDGDVCGGTLAPVSAPSSNGGVTGATGGEPDHYQCNSCGFVRSEDEFLRSLAELDDGDDDESYEDDEEMEGE